MIDWNYSKKVEIYFFLAKFTFFRQNLLFLREIVLANHQNHGNFSQKVGFCGSYRGRPSFGGEALGGGAGSPLLFFLPASGRRGVLKGGAPPPL